MGRDSDFGEQKMFRNHSVVPFGRKGFLTNILANKCEVVLLMRDAVVVRLTDMVTDFRRCLVLLMTVSLLSCSYQLLCAIVYCSHVWCESRCAISGILVDLISGTLDTFNESQTRSIVC